jgi:phosphoglycerate dehydrogenase-like enzyme
MLRAIYCLDPVHRDTVFGPATEADIAKLVETNPVTQATIDPAVFRDVNVVLGGWDMPVIDAEFLAAAPKLKAVFYSAGSIRRIATDAMWERGIIITSAYAANAIPVAEFTVAAIVMSLKHVWQYAFAARREAKHQPRHPVPGCYLTTVGLISLGMVGRTVAERLRGFEMRVIAYDPFVKPDEAKRLGIELVPLDQVFREADIVSLHTPLMPATEGMITGEHLGLMKSGATFLNTARGAVVRQDEMIAVLRQRPDLTAVLDVTYPEPLPATSPLFTLPNVVLTPHIAGSMHYECRRLGRYAFEELQRYVTGQPLRWQVTRELAARLA